MLGLLCNRSKVIYTHTLERNSSSLDKTGKQASRRATYHFKTAVSLPTGKQTFPAEVSPRVLHQGTRAAATGAREAGNSPAARPPRLPPAAAGDAELRVTFLLPNNHTHSRLQS